MTTRLVLWDIDHTLIETRGVGSQVYAEAFAKVTGRQLETMPELAGRTEPVIFRDALRVNGVESSEDLYEKFAAAQAQGYVDHLDELHRQGRALPGAREVLEALAERDDMTQSVLTGNTRPAAEIKLRAFGLDRYINFDIGAYGTDDDTRANLVGIARQRAEQAHAQDYEAGQTIRVVLKNGEGSFVADEPTLDELEREGRVVFRYLGTNPNGSLRDIAGITNEAGNVVGLMPHPEHAVEPLIGSGRTDGLPFFTSILKKLVNA